MLLKRKKVILLNRPNSTLVSVKYFSLSVLVIMVMLIIAGNAQAESFVDRLTPKWGEFRLKLVNTTAEKWKATWYCFDKRSDGSADM